MHQILQRHQLHNILRPDPQLPYRRRSKAMQKASEELLQFVRGAGVNTQAKTKRKKGYLADGKRNEGKCVVQRYKHKNVQDRLTFLDRACYQLFRADIQLDSPVSDWRREAPALERAKEGTTHKTHMKNWSCFKDTLPSTVSND